MVRTALSVVLVVGCALGGVARAGGLQVTRRFAVVVAHHDGGPGRAQLRHAQNDAKNMRDVLVELGGVDAADVRLLIDEDRHAVEEALAAVAVDVAGVRARGERPELFVYYSGHADDDGLLLGEERLPWAALRDEISAVEADVKVVVLDACSSGAMVRAKGGRRRPPLLVDERTAVKGQALLTSSAADEASQESERLGGSYFTHALVSGLRGAADVSGDGRVTLDEAYRFAFHETLARTETTTGGVQHATREVDLTGAGELVLTDLRDVSGRLVLHDDVRGRVFVRTRGEGALVAEVTKDDGRSLTLAVPHGPYDVVVVDGLSARRAQVRVEDTPAVVAAVGLVDVDLEEAVPRGLQPLTRFPINLAFVSPLEINSYAPRVENHLGLALLFGSSARLFGVDLAIGGNFVHERMTGAMLALGFNGVRGPATGALLGGTNLALADMTGVMGGLFFNLGTAQTTGAAWALANVHDAFTGAQVGLVNVAGTVVGAQVGLVNVADTVTGAQVGLVNVASASTAPVGLVSLVGDGQAGVAVFGSDLVVWGASARAGGRFVWTEAQVGASPLLTTGGRWLPVVSLGVGGTVEGAATPLGRFFVDVDVHGGGLGLSPFAALSVRGRLRPVPGLAISAGPELRLVDAAAVRVQPWAFVTKDGRAWWPGFVVGVGL